MSLSHWVIEIRSRYARNRGRGKGWGVIDGCHYQLTRSRHRRVGQLIPLLAGSLCYADSHALRLFADAHDYLSLL